MVKELKNIKVTIFGKSYTLATDDSERDVLNAVEFVDKKMKDLATAIGVNDGYSAAVMLALELASELNKSKASAELVQQKVSRLSSLVDSELS